MPRLGVRLRHRARRTVHARCRPPLIKRIGERAGPPSVHAHMLRHGCGYAVANAGHDTRAIQMG
jgi:integrase